MFVITNSARLGIVEHITRRWGLVPFAATSARDALRLVDEGNPFDLAIFDLQMPGMDGSQLAAELRLRRSAEQLPLIAISALGDNGHGLNAGPVDCLLTKPLKLSALFNAINSFFGTNPVPPAHIPILDSQLAIRHPLRILLAEDQAVNLRVAQLMLSRLGYTCTCVSDGRQVIDLVAREPFDVILLDVQMPALNGLETAAQLGVNLPVSVRPWIIAMTANAMAGDRQECLDAGMDDYLAKPISAKPLAQALARAAEQLELRRVIK